MNTQARSRRATPGFTLVELLVVITIIGMLVALLLPAVNAARSAARKSTCLSNMRQAGLGVIQYETDKQRFPGYVEPVKRTATQYARVIGNSLNSSQIDAIDVRGDSLISWAGHIAPYIEQNPIWDSLQDTTVVSGEPRAVIRPVEILICPADTDLTALIDNAGMSYVGNCGAWDTNSSGSLLENQPQSPPKGDTKANGIFHQRTDGRVKVNLVDISSADGASTTLMLSENVHRNPEYCWLGVAPPASSSGPYPEAHFGMVWITSAGGSPTNANALISTSESDLIDPSELSYQAPLGQEVGIDFTGNTPGYVRPSSGHPGGSFNAVFADGHGRSLDPGIDPIVYQQLMAPNNRKCVDSFNHDLVDQNPILQYRNAAPLSPSDFE